MEDTPLNTDDKNTTDLYNQTFRFGNSTEGGIKFQIIPEICRLMQDIKDRLFSRGMFSGQGGVAIEVVGQSA